MSSSQEKATRYNMKIIKGTLWVLLYICLSIINETFTFNGVRIIGLHPAQMVFSRFFVSAVSLIPLFFFINKQTHDKKHHITSRVLNNLYTKHIMQHILRAIMLGMGIFTYIYTYRTSNISMSINVIAASLTPLFSSIFAYIFFKDNLIRQIPIFALSITGTILALSTHFTINNIFAARFMLISVICYALTDLINKLSINSKEESLVIMFYTNLFVALILLPFAIIHWQAIGLRQYVVFLIAGINGNIMSFCLIKSLGYTDVSTLQPLKYLKLPLAFICDKSIFHTSISMQLWAGFGLILLSSIISTHIHSKRKDTSQLLEDEVC